MIFYSELERLPTYDVRGNYLGHIVDLALNPSWDPLRVASYLIKTPGKQVVCVTHEQIPSISVRSIQTNVPREEIRCSVPDEGIIRIKKDVLDQQIIDVNDQKVVRVIDVDFDIQPHDNHTDLRIVAVSVGLASAVRRLLQGLLAKHKIRSIAGLFPPKTIPWDFVSLIEPDPARRVKLRISYSRLSKLHPADIADILEELSRDDQRSVIESLDDEIAAEAMSEIPMGMQVALLDSLPAGRAADIVEEMAPDEAADVLQELPPETSAAVLANMETEEAEEVRELLAFEEHTAGGLMTTEVIMLEDTATVEGAINSLKKFDGPLESIHAVYLVDSKRVLAGAVALARLLLVESNTLLKDLCLDPVISVPYYADDKTVISMFRKYNLLALPVVDEVGRSLGVVTADDVLDLVVKEG